MQPMHLVPLHAAILGAADGVLVELPADAGADERADAVEYVAGLVRKKRIAFPGQPAPPDATHAIEADGEGRRRLIRLGYRQA